MWAGGGIVLIAVAGGFLYREIADLPAIIGMCLVIIGVAVIPGHRSRSMQSNSAGRAA